MRARFARSLAVVACICAAAVGSVFAATQAAAGTTASNRQAAIADAKQLLAGVHPPAGAVLQSSGTGVGPSAHLLTLALASAVAYRTWNVPGDSSSVLAAVEAHLPAGSTQIISGYGPEDQSVIRSWPAVAGVLGLRWLRIEVASAPSGGTTLSAKSQSQWIVTRNAAERIPPGVREVDVTSGWPGKPPLLSLRVTSEAKVHELVSLFDSLGVLQPGVVNCPEIMAPTVIVSFRARGRRVARAMLSAQSDVSWPAYTGGWACFATQLSILGRHVSPLVGNVIRPIQRLLHVRLAARG
jgi:hypothetical protein